MSENKSALIELVTRSEIFYFLTLKSLIIEILNFLFSNIEIPNYNIEQTQNLIKVEPPYASQKK